MGFTLPLRYQLSVTGGSILARLEIEWWRDYSQSQVGGTETVGLSRGRQPETIVGTRQNRMPKQLNLRLLGTPPQTPQE